MFTFLVTRSLRNRLLVLAMSLVLVVFGTLQHAAPPGRRAAGP